MPSKKDSTRYSGKRKGLIWVVSFFKRLFPDFQDYFLSFKTGFETELNKKSTRWQWIKSPMGQKFRVGPYIYSANQKVNIFIKSSFQQVRGKNTPQLIDMWMKTKKYN